MVFGDGRGGEGGREGLWVDSCLGFWTFGRRGWIWMVGVEGGMGWDISVAKSGCQGESLGYR